MNVTVFLPLLALILVIGSGCTSLRRSPPERPIASEVEHEFKERWVQRRTLELVKEGKAADALQARRIAQDEFKQHYEFTSDAKP